MTEATAPCSVFVYGTLRPGEANHCLVHRLAPEIEPAVLRYHGLLGDGYGFPYCVPSLTDDCAGDLVTFDRIAWPIALHDLDLLEGNGRHYQREVVTVETARGESRAWVYVPLDADFIRENYRPVPGNDWSLRTRRPLANR